MTSYTLQKKAAELDPAAADPTAPEGDPAEAQVHEWAGDAYEEDDVSDPAAAFASLSGVAGEQAWLDRHDDGTLVGWVRDADGTVYRYTDADAWAIDVEDAGMQRTDGEQSAPAEGEATDAEPVDGEPTDEAPAAPALDDATADAPPVDTEPEPSPADAPGGDGEPLDDLAAEEGAAAAPDADADPQDPDDDEDDERELPFQTKSFAHASGVGRIVVTPR